MFATRLCTCCVKLSSIVFIRVVSLPARLIAIRITPCLCVSPCLSVLCFDWFCVKEPPPFPQEMLYRNCGTIQKLLICSWYYEWAKNIIKSASNGIRRVTFWLRSVPVFSDVVVTSLSSIVVLPPNGNFLVMPVLLSLSGMCCKVWWERCHDLY